MCVFKKKCDLVKTVSATVEAGTWLPVVLPLGCKQGYNRSFGSMGIVNSIAPISDIVEGTMENHIYHLHTQEDKE